MNCCCVELGPVFFDELYVDVLMIRLVPCPIQPEESWMITLGRWHCCTVWCRAVLYGTVQECVRNVLLLLLLLLCSLRSGIFCRIPSHGAIWCWPVLYRNVFGLCYCCCCWCCCWCCVVSVAVWCFLSIRSHLTSSCWYLSQLVANEPTTFTIVSALS